MSVRIAGRSYELLSASTSLSDDDQDVPVDASASLSDDDDIPVDASITSAPPAYEDEDEAEETIYFDTRDEVVHPESDDLLEEAAAAAVNGLVDGAVLAVAVGAVAD